MTEKTSSHNSKQGVGKGGRGRGVGGKGGGRDGLGGDGVRGGGRDGGGMLEMVQETAHSPSRLDYSSIKSHLPPGFLRCKRSALQLPFVMQIRKI